jgi:glutamate carboxypeptidase
VRYLEVFDGKSLLNASSLMRSSHPNHLRRMIPSMENLLEHFKSRTPEILADLEKLVRLESPSKDVAAINRVQDAIATMLDGLGSVARHTTDLGDVLHFTMPGQSPDRVVYLAHADTVYAHGFWANIWRVEGDQVFGPGVYDMKGGIVQAIHALRAIRELGLEPASTIELLVTPDEEIESRAGRPFIEKLATGAKAVIVLEPPHLNGDLKVARKGVGGYRVTVHGKAAHQGTEPENGRNAIVSAAYLITEVVKLQDLTKGTTLGPNVIRGGTVMNVVADAVYLEVDLRVWSQEEADRVDAAIKAIQPLEGTRYEILDGLNRPPMEPSDGTWKLLETGQRIAHKLGFDPGAARVGGGSDGNFTAKLAPTIDGFGIHGKNAHQRELEYITISDIAPRTALVAGMMLEV